MNRQPFNLKDGVWLTPLVALWALAPWHPTIIMCLIAVSLYVFIKAHILILFATTVNRMPSTADSITWLCGWPGMNARDFFPVPQDDSKLSNGNSAVRSNAFRFDWRMLGFAALKILFGCVCLFIIAPLFHPKHSQVGGVIAMIGIVFLVHFGFFHLLAVVWNAIGRPVKPIMNAPVLSQSVAEFWGKRWNLAFRDYAHLTIFSPLSRRINIVAGTILGFLFSGFIHELAISVPAQGGYGLPTLYFLLQAIGILAERGIDKSGVKVRNRLGWLWTIIWVLLPAPLLFHSAFITNVVIPIVDAISKL